MKIFPAIDLKDGQCVRLYQGDFKQQTVVNPDPLEQAKEFADKGATYLHIVDLDGALVGQAVSAPIIKTIKEETQLNIEVGGGIRTLEQVDAYIAAGIDRLIIGSAALNNPAFVKEAVARYGDKIAVGIDAKQGFVAISGWLDVSQTDYISFAKEMEKIGVSTIIYTDIDKDGTLAGPNISHYQALQEAVDMQIIASGGVSGKADLEALAQLGIYGAIVGKAYYSGRITMTEILEVEALC